MKKRGVGLVKKLSGILAQVGRAGRSNVYAVFRKHQIPIGCSSVLDSTIRTNLIAQRSQPEDTATYLVLRLGYWVSCQPMEDTHIFWSCRGMEWFGKQLMSNLPRPHSLVGVASARLYGGSIPPCSAKSPIVKIWIRQRFTRLPLLVQIQLGLLRLILKKS